jgi:hypothetical protein
MTPALVPLPTEFAQFPKSQEAVYLLFDYVSKNGGSIDDSRVHHFYKEYPECRNLFRGFSSLPEFFSSDRSEGLLSWRAGTEDEEGLIDCKIQTNQKISQNIVNIKAKITSLRKLDAMNSFDMKLKKWLDYDSILKETFRFDFSKLSGSYRHYSSMPLL